MLTYGNRHGSVERSEMSAKGANSYKLKKYQHRYISTLNANKKEYYQKKINYYRSLIGGTTLMEPRPYIGKEYDLDNYLNDPIKIRAIGYGATSKIFPLQLVEFERRAPYESDVVVKLLYCGVCLSDWHYLLGEWKGDFPMVPGHEATGIIVKVGTAVNKFVVGDKVGIGPYINSCRVCARCREGLEQYCENGASFVFNSRDRYPGEIKATAEKTYGCWSNVITVNQDFVFKIPDNLPLDRAAPLLDAGITTYSPLSKAGIKPGMKVGISGIGGLGHLAVKFAKAMGAFVVAFTTTEWKLSDAKTIGADETVLVTDEEQMVKHKNTLDYLLSTIPIIDDINMHLDLLAFRGTMCIVGYFDNVELNIDTLGQKRILKTSTIGGVPEIREMLDFCSRNNIVADIETIPIQSINETHRRMVDSSVRYRFVVDLASL